jgi:hypothetical protein
MPFLQQSVINCYAKVQKFGEVSFLRIANNDAGYFNRPITNE